MIIEIILLVIFTLYNEKWWVFPIDINWYSKIINILVYTTDTNPFYAKVDAGIKNLEIIENNDCYWKYKYRKCNK